jgi:hypothetical protein
MKRTLVVISLLLLTGSSLVLVAVAPVPAQTASAFSFPCPESLAGVPFNPQASSRPNTPDIDATGRRSYVCAYARKDAAGAVTSAVKVIGLWFEPPTSATCPLLQSFDDGTNAGSASPTRVAAVAYYGDSSGAVPTAPLRGLASELLTAVELVATLCPGASPAPSAAVCRITGAVTATDGMPVSHVRIQLNGPGLQLETATDGSGRYVFDRWLPSRTQFDPKTDHVTVSLFLKEAGTFHRFEFMYKSDPVELTTAPFPVTGTTCTQDLGSVTNAATAVPSDANNWPHLWAMYRQIATAYRYAGSQVGQLLNGRILTIHTWCDSVASSCRKGGPLFEEGADDLYVPDSASETQGDAPYDAIWHEFGHYLMRTVYGPDFTSTVGQSNHGGYYTNAATSNDSWQEGFATFFSSMVGRWAENLRPQYRQGASDAPFPLEADIKAWDANGDQEEFAVAALLVDFVDGAADYQAPDVPPVPIDNIRYKIQNNVVVGIAPLEVGSAGALVWAEFRDTAGSLVALKPAWVNTSPGSMVDGGYPFFIPVPAGVSFASIKLGGVKDAGRDDDPITVPESDVWHSLFSADPSADPKLPRKVIRPSGFHHIWDVSELYTILKRDYGGKDANSNGIDEVDDVFLAHGFFADINGNRLHDPGETIGLTSHPLVGSDGTPSGASVTRYEPPLLPEEEARLDAHGVQSGVIEFVDYPKDPARSYASAVDPRDGSFGVLVPPAETDATVTLVAVAPGYVPKVIGEVRAGSFWKEAAANPGKSFLSFDVRLDPGSVRIGRSSSRARGALMSIAGAVVFALAGLWLILSARRRRVPTGPS